MSRSLRSSTGVLLVLALCTAAACAGGGASPAASRAPATTAAASPDASPSSSAPASDAPTSGDPAAVPEAVLRPILADAAARAGIDPSQLTLVHAAAVEYNDGSLGCPEPGMMYTQAIVPGWQVILEHAGERIDYRASGPGVFRVCAEGGEPLPGDS